MHETRFKGFTDLELNTILGYLAYGANETSQNLSKEIVMEQEHRELGIAQARSAPIYYFGCWHESGHYFHDQYMRHYWRDVSELLPESWRNRYDGGLLPKGRSQEEGRAIILHEDGWTALSFWDRSVDHRGNSNSTFYLRHVLDFMPMLELCKLTFPQVFERFTFKVVQDA